MCAMCGGQSLKEYVTGMHELIGRHGWALQYVSDADADDSLADTDETVIVPAFCYTIGLTAYDHPELIITGRSAHEAASVLNELARRVALGFAQFEAGLLCSAGGFELSFVDVPDRREWLAMASLVYPLDEIEALQAVWRDVNGHLPWEGPYPSTIVQPVLGAPRGWDDVD
ncbi:MAG: DUF4262 domain-containing protein [Rhodococcus sp. (in: high G+C Gram-positive bacteria)]